MATSSITKSFVVYGEEQAERFADAIEEFAQKSTPLVKVNVTKIQGPEQLRNLMAKRKKMNAGI